VVGLEHRELQFAAEDVSWLTVPMPTLDSATGKTVSVFPVSQASSKAKDGNRKKSRGNSVSEHVTILIVFIHSVIHLHNMIFENLGFPNKVYISWL